MGAREGHTETVAALLTANADPTKLNMVMNNLKLYIACLGDQLHNIKAAEFYKNETQKLSLLY